MFDYIPFSVSPDFQVGHARGEEKVYDFCRKDSASSILVKLINSSVGLLRWFNPSMFLN